MRVRCDAVWNPPPASIGFRMHTFCKAIYSSRDCSSHPPTYHRTATCTGAEYPGTSGFEDIPKEVRRHHLLLLRMHSRCNHRHDMQPSPFRVLLPQRPYITNCTDLRYARPGFTQIAPRTQPPSVLETTATMLLYPVGPNKSVRMAIRQGRWRSTHLPHS